MCAFLVPVVRDSDRRPHHRSLWRLLQDALLDAFGAVTGPELVLYYRRIEPVSGLWKPSRSETPVEDVSRRYSVAIPETQVDELRELLRRAGNSFDQRVMYLEVAGYAELLEVKPEDDFLRPGGPETGGGR